MTALSQGNAAAALQHLPGWNIADGTLRKTFTTSSFVEAMGLVNRVAELAEAAGHHPDITIAYNRATFSLVTHSEGGITSKDVDLAGKIEQVATK